MPGKSRVKNGNLAGRLCGPASVPIVPADEPTNRIQEGRDMPWLPILGAIAVPLLLIEVFSDDDQEERHAEEQKRSRAKITELKHRISALEQEHDALLLVLGKKNRQVRLLADEICRLRSELEEARR